MRTGQGGREGAALEKSFSRGLHIQDLTSANAKKIKKCAARTKSFITKKKTQKRLTASLAYAYKASTLRSIGSIRQNLLSSILARSVLHLQRLFWCSSSPMKQESRVDSLQPRQTAG